MISTPGLKQGAKWGVKQQSISFNSTLDKNIQRHTKQVTVGNSYLSAGNRVCMVNRNIYNINNLKQ